MQSYHGVGRTAPIALLAIAVSMFACRDTASPDQTKISKIGSANYAAAPGPDLVAAYGFNEASGTAITDASANNNAGTMGGGVSRVTSGKFGGGLSFSGSGMVTVPNSASLSLTSAMTLEAWVNPTAVNSNWRDVVYKGNDNYYLMATSTKGPRPATGVTFPNGSQKEAYGTATLVANVWTHLAMTYDGASVRLYVNGSQVATTTASGAILTSSNPLTIGGDAIYGQFFQGSIDEVRIYNRALSVAEVQADMNTPVGETPLPPSDTNKPSISIAGPTSAATYATSTNTLNLSGAASDNVGVTQVTWSNSRGGSGTATGIASWSVSNIPLQMGTNVMIVTARDAASNTAADTLTVTLTAPSSGQTGLVAAYGFNEASGTSVSDASSNNNSGAMGSGVSRSASGKFGGALSFNGSGMVTIPNSPSLSLTTAMTLEAWVNPTAVPADWTDVIFKGDDNYFLMASSTAGTKPVAGVTFAGECCTSKAVGPGTLAANTWTHLAATYDGAMLRLYVNGSQVATFAGDDAISTSTNPLQIGGDNFYGQFFRGLIDEVRVYNRALSVVELVADMNTPVGGSAPPPPPPPAADTTKPSVSITSPGSSGTYTVTSSPLSMAGVASDNVGVSQVSWSSSRGASGVASGTSNWSTSVALQSGSNVVTVSAKDAANNTTSTTVTVTYNPPAAPTATALAIQTQPSSSAESGVSFAQQPVIQLRDASNNPIGQSGVSVTAAIATGGGSLAGTTTVATNASGVATFTNLSISGTAGARTLSFSAPPLTAATSTSINVTVTPPPPPPAPPANGEPVFNASVNSMVFQDNMDAYTSATAMGAANRTGPLITPSPSPLTTGGAVNTSQNQIITDRSGTGKALRLGFSGQTQTSATFMTWNTPNTPNNVTHYFQYYARITFQTPLNNTLAVKWFEVWHKSGIGRMQWSTHDHLPCKLAQTGHHSYWQVYDRAETTCQANQPIGPYINDLTNDNTWHRFTYEWKPNSRAGARDGVARMWVDGVKIIDVSASAIGVTPPGGDKPWCYADDVDALVSNDGVENQWWGSTQTSNTSPWTMDIDDYKWWYKP